MRSNREVLAAPGLGGRILGNFEEFYRAEYPAMVRLAWLLTASASACEDLTQDAFAATYRHYGDLEHPVSYLRAALVNRCRTWHRDEASRWKKLLRLHEEHCEITMPDPQLVKAVKKLSYRQQVVIFARYWADWSEAEIAEVLSCSPGTVKSLASRALARLREEVRDQ